MAPWKRKVPDEPAPQIPRAPVAWDQPDLVQRYISSRVVVRRCGRRSGFAKSIAVCRVLFTASGVA